MHSESAPVSLLVFDGTYTHQLIELEYVDTLARHAQRRHS
jgi:hypothetical protein